MTAGYDEQLFRLINISWANPFCDNLMILVSELGGGEAIFIMSFLVLVLARKEKRRAAILLWAGLTVTYYVTFILKGAFGRPRPCIALPDIRIFVMDRTPSFPSGHTMQSFMAATVMARVFPRGALLFLPALLVAFSRIYTGAHYPADTLAGAALGILIGYALTLLAREGRGDHRA